MMTHLEVSSSTSASNGFSELMFKQKHKINGIEIVDLETDDPHDQDTLGFRLSGSRSVGVFIKSIHCGSPADLIGKIHAGDQLLQVNEIALSGMTPDQAVRILRGALSFSGRVRVTVAHPWADRPKSRQATSSALSPSLSDGHLATRQVPETDGPPPLAVRHKIKTAAKRASIVRHEAEVHRHFSSRAKVSPEFLPSMSVDAVATGDDLTTTYADDATTSSDDIPLVPLSPLSPVAGNSSENTIVSVGKTSATRKISANHATNNKGRFRAWESEDNNLHVPSSVADKSDNEDLYNARKAKSFGPEEVKQMIVSAPRKSFRKQMSNEELPLVSFDQLSQLTPSPTDTKRSGDRGDSSQSKSSKSSNASNRSSQSQQMSWHCPVCLDGATRIRRTKRRMMSTVCGHVFCSKCVEDVINKYRMCPTCRTSLTGLSEVHPIFM